MNGELPLGQKGIQSIELGFQLLTALEQARVPLSLSALAERTGFSPSKARNYLVSLLRVDMVQQDPVTGRYALGPGALRLGLTALAQIEPLDVTFEEMRRRQDAIAATCFLAVWGNRGPVIVRWLEGPEQVTVEVRTGSVLPATQSATGWAFLAYMPDALTRSLVAEELNSDAASQSNLDRRLAATRKHGLARVDGDLLPGISGMAIPIVDHDGRVRTVATAIGRRGTVDLDYDGILAGNLRALKASVEQQIGVRTDAA